MFENLKIKDRLVKSFRIVAILASVAAIIGVVMMIISNNQYSDALKNYGFSQGDIGKAMIVFTDARGATRGIIGYDREDLVEDMIEQHDTKKAAFEEYWAICAETLASDEEEALYQKVNDLLEEYWVADAKVIEAGKDTDAEISRKAQEEMAAEVAPLYNEIYELLLQLLNANVNQGNSL